MELTLREIVKVTADNHYILANFLLDKEISNVCIDSRQVAKSSLFVPFVGESVNGYDFVESAFENGAAAVLWEKDQPNPPWQLGPVIIVEDNLKSLQHLAKYYLSKLNCKTIGITGSNGKTSTKDILAAICESSFVTYKTNGNYNNHLGLPLTILSAARNTEVLILEMGMSGFKEIELLSSIATPDFAIITNIGESHIEHLGSRAGIAKAKFEIVEYLSSEGKLVFDGDEPLLTELVEKHETPSISVGYNPSNDLLIKSVTNDLTPSFELTGAFSLTAKSNLLGKHQIKNSAVAITVAKLLGISDENIQQSLNSISLTPMRMQLIELPKTTIINDCYNASPTSMRAAISFLKDCPTKLKKTLVFGDMLELGEDSNKYHIDFNTDIFLSKFDQFIFIGEHSFHLYNAVTTVSESRLHQLTTFDDQVNIHYFRNVDDAIANKGSFNFDGHLVLFKGSRGMKLEKLIEIL